MKKTILAILAAASAIGLAQPANAAIITPGMTTGGASHNATFTLVPGSGSPLTGTQDVTASFSDYINLGSTSTPFSFTDDFRFKIGPFSGPTAGSFIGLGSGTLSTTVNTFGSSQDLDLISVIINNGHGYIFSLPITSPPGDLKNLSESAGTSGVKIYSGATIDLIVSGNSRGKGYFNGSLTFSPSAVPEASTWAMMLLGFGFLGMAFRRRPRLALQAV